MIFSLYGVNIQRTILILLLFAASVLQIFLIVEDITGRWYIRLFFHCFLLIAEIFCCGILLSMDWSREVPDFLYLLEAVLLAYAVFRYIRTLHRTKQFLSRESIKEGIDNLPDGVCFFDENGTVRLINRKMLSLGSMLFGKEIQTIDELHAALLKPPAAVERLDEEISLYRFPDGTVRRFTERTITDVDGSPVTEVVAADVTKLYAKQTEMNLENNRLMDVNRKIKHILDNMEEIVRDEEILSMKMRVHDDIGYSILSAKKVLLKHEDIAVIHENAVLWENAVDLLYRANTMPSLPDEWEAAKGRAADLGVEIELNGELPKHEFLRHLIILAIRECVTNCVQHAKGNKIFVATVLNEKEIVCVITNNGKTPKSKIAEGGGLSGLRRRIEREDGTMKLQSSPYFALTVVLPIKEVIL